MCVRPVAGVLDCGDDRHFSVLPKGPAEARLGVCENRRPLSENALSSVVAAKTAELGEKLLQRR
jgi:hypothetical protein